MTAKLTLDVDGLAVVRAAESAVAEATPPNFTDYQRDELTSNLLMHLAFRYMREKNATASIRDAGVFAVAHLEAVFGPIPGDDDDDDDDTLETYPGFH
jgi:hypothetical protein